MGHVDPADAGHGASAHAELAAHTLELLDLLADKTKGNLDGEEERLLDAVRTEIRSKLR